MYERVVAELLLQRTTAKAVDEALPRLLQVYPDWGSIARSTEVEIGMALKPLGLWRRRATTLLSLSRAILRNGGIPSERAAIEELPGMGQYMANATELLIHGERRPLLDVNMARVLERLFGPRSRVDIRFDPHLQRLAAQLVSEGDAQTLNFAVLDLAALVCRPKPDCPHCPLLAVCPTGAPRVRQLAHDKKTSADAL